MNQIMGKANFLIRKASALSFGKKRCAVFTKSSQSSQSSHIFESQARVRIKYNYNTTPYEIPPKFYL